MWKVIWPVSKKWKEAVRMEVRWARRSVLTSVSSTDSAKSTSSFSRISKFFLVVKQSERDWSFQRQVCPCMVLEVSAWIVGGWEGKFANSQGAFTLHAVTQATWQNGTMQVPHILMHMLLAWCSSVECCCNGIFASQFASLLTLLWRGQGLKGMQHFRVQSAPCKQWGKNQKAKTKQIQEAKNNKQPRRENSTFRVIRNILPEVKGSFFTLWWADEFLD